MQGEWYEHDGALMILACGESFAPSAAEIFALAFQGALSVRGVAVPSPLLAFPHISFSRFAAEPVVRLSGTTPLSVIATIGVLAGEGYALLPGNGDSLIADGRWFPVDQAGLHELTSRLAALDIALGTPLTLRALITIRQEGLRGLQLVDETQPEPPGSGLEPELSIPNLKATLYEYQRIGVTFLRLVAEQGVGCILADEMGLGKTLQVIALLALEQDAGRGPSLIIAPSTVLENWRRELERFAPSLEVLIHAGGSRSGVPSILEAFDVVVTSYDTAVRDQTLLGEIQWNVLAIDEAQAIKNPEAQRTIALKGLSRRVSIAVSGTPVENRLEDLWSLSDFALPRLLGDRAFFRATYSDTTSDAKQLSRIVSPIMLRREVSSVAGDLPLRLEIPQALTMSRSLALLYESSRLACIGAHGNSPALAAIAYLRQLCAHPQLVGPWTGDLAHHMPKYERLLELLEELFLAGEKALIFCAFHAMADLLLSDLAKRWPGGLFAALDGRTAISDRQPLVDRFSSHVGYGALVLNPKAAGTGLNITAANHVIHYTPEWNPATTDQASARAYRRGQTRPVTVHHLYFVDTIEEAMVDRATFKRALSQDALGESLPASETTALELALRLSPLSTAVFSEEP